MADMSVGPTCSKLTRASLACLSSCSSLYPSHNISEIMGPLERMAKLLVFHTGTVAPDGALDKRVKMRNNSMAAAVVQCRAIHPHSIR